MIPVVHSRLERILGLLLLHVSGSRIEHGLSILLCQVVAINITSVLMVKLQG
jgi:hypothetical protein